MKLRTYLYLIIFLTFANYSLAQHTQIYTHSSEDYRKGLELYDLKQYATAQDHFKRYLRLDLDNEQSVYASYYVAVCALKLEQADADILLEKFVNQYPNHSNTHSAYYDWGKQYYDNGNFDKAIEYLGRITDKKLDEDRVAQSQYFLGQSYLKKKQYDKAKEYFDQLKRGTSQYVYDAFYYAGYIAYFQKNYNEATQDLLKAEQSERYRKNAPLMIADAYYQQTKYDELIKYAFPLLLKNTDLEQIEKINLLLADAYFQRQKYDKAQEYYRNYISLITEKAKPEVSYRLGYSQFQAKDYEGAILNFQEVALQDNELGQNAAFYLGKSYLANNQKQFAITAFEQVKKSHFNKELEQEAIWTLGKLYYEQEQYNEALTTLKSFVKNYPKHKDISLANDLLSQTYLYSNNYPEAIAYIESLPQKTRKVKTAYQQITYTQATEYFNNENYPKAIELFQKSMDNSQRRELAVAAKYWMAEALALNQESEKAVEHYQAILDIFEQENYYTLKSHYGLGYAYYNTEKYDLATPHFQKYVITMAGQDDGGFHQDAMIRLADCLYAQKEYSRALEYYDKAINADYADKDYAYFQKGVILATEARDAEAQANLDKVIKEYPESRFFDEAMFTKALIYHERNDFYASITAFGNFIKTKPKSDLIPKALLKKGLGHKNVGQNQSAIQDYSKIVEKYPSTSSATDALYELQELLAENPTELNRLLAVHRKANPNSNATESIYFEQAKTAYFSLDYTRAISLLESFVKNYTQSTYLPDAEHFLGESYYRQKNYEKALEYHTLVAKSNQGNYVGRSALRAGDLSLKKKAYQNAINFYRFLAYNTDSKRAQLKAWEGLVEGYYEVAKYDSLDFYAKEIVEKGQGSKNKAILYRGKVAHKQGKYSDALTLLGNISPNDRDRSAAEAYYLKGFIYKEQKKHKESIEVLLDLNRKFIYEEWRGKSQLLIADNYIEMGEKFQAKATLENIIDKIEDREIVQKAKEKLKEI